MFYGVPSKSREISVEFYYLVEKLIKKNSKNGFDRGGILVKSETS